jgi:WD40 repeat protein
VAFSPDGKQVVSGSDDNTVRIWDAVTGAALHMLEAHSGSVRSVAFSPDGNIKYTLYTSNNYVAEGGQIFSGFRQLIERVVGQSVRKLLY